MPKPHTTSQLNKLLILIILSTPIIVNIGSAISAAPNIRVKWQAELAIPSILTNSQSNQEFNANLNALIANMQTQMVRTNIQANKLSLAGDQEFGTLRSLLFANTTDSSLNLLGGPVELTIESPTTSTNYIVRLQTQMTSGYIWHLDLANSDYVQDGHITYHKLQPGLGTPTIQIIPVKKLPTATTNNLRLVYQRPFASTEPTRIQLKIQLSARVEVLDLTDPTLITQLLPNTQSATTSTSRNFPPPRTALQNLPVAYDSRSLGIVPPIRDQKTCGACWAFGTVGIMEIAIAKNGGPLVDLSEQFLVSCNRDNWSCNGGLTASKYHYDTIAKAQTAPGTVLETTKPYTATNGTCTTNYTHPYLASNWQFLAGSEWELVATQQIKTAIFTYGAVTAGVCAQDTDFVNYRSGVYNPTANNCNNSTNHQIDLIGWDDTTQTWILRNSWGPNWGEAGYMHIRYDPNGVTSRVGEGASWIAVAPILKYTVTPSVNGIGGSINPNTSQTVAAGTNQSFMLTPNHGYKPVFQVSGTCPAGTWADNTWTSGLINNNCNVQFRFFCPQCMPSSWRSILEY
ncbi:hypothetical protein TI04_05790 [Achromatium sp. WMS2]|nr:hypothetical protein TI04_05790 [Achromatium sp. WMS2]